MASFSSSTSSKNTVHFKGYGRSIDFSDPATRAYADLVAEHITDGGFTRLVWDGDSYDESSFTFLIPRFYASIPGLELVAFLRECDQDRFWRDWGKAPASHG